MKKETIVKALRDALKDSNEHNNDTTNVSINIELFSNESIRYYFSHSSVYYPSETKIIGDIKNQELVIRFDKILYYFKSYSTKKLIEIAEDLKNEYDEVTKLIGA